MQDFKKLDVWALAHRLALDIYASTETFPVAELYGMSAQLRRASASIVANIAEGSARSGPREFARFLDVARASAVEVECHLLLARDLGYLDSSSFEALARDTDRVRRMLTALIKRVRRV